MSDDLELAGLLGEAPRSPDPGFRFDVVSRVAERARRRTGRQRAIRTLLVFALIGAIFPFLRAFGLTLADAQPLLLVAGVLGLAYVGALLSIEGPRAVLARSAQVLRARI